MRRMVSLFLSIVLLAPTVRAAETPKFVALTFDTPSAVSTGLLLEGLAKREIQATFFLNGGQTPEQARSILDGGHEIGLLVSTARDGQMLSRRQIAGEIVKVRSRLPEGCKVKWLRTAEGCSDAARQVAKAKNLAVLEDRTDGLMEVISDGDVVYFRGATADVALSVVDRLRTQGFQVVTVTELARVRRVQIRPGRIYRTFAREILPSVDSTDSLMP